MNRVTSRARVARAIMSGIIISVVAAPLADARVLDGPFWNAHGGLRQGAGEARGAAFPDGARGVLELYAEALDGAVASRMAAWGRLGNDYALNRGPLILPSYNAEVTVDASLRGELVCVDRDAPRSAARVTLRLLQLRQVGTTYQPVAERELAEYDACRSGVPLDAQVTRSTRLAFARGESYLLALEAEVSATSIAPGSSARVHLCSAEGRAVEGCTADGGVRLHSITIANLPPSARFEDEATWFVTALLVGATAHASACDPDGAVGAVVVSVTGFGSATSTGRSDEDCLKGKVRFSPVAPGIYEGRALARDDEGSESWDLGKFSVSVLPFQSRSVDIPTTFVLRRPPVEKSVVDVAAVLDAEGRVRWLRAFDPLGPLGPAGESAEAGPGEHVALARLDLATMTATVLLDGAVAWSGPVEPAGTEWWDVAPIR